MAAVAQLSGEFYLEKTTFAPGEPVFLYFKLSNNGPDAVEVVEPDPEQPFCSGISITVSKDPADDHMPELGSSGLLNRWPAASFVSTAARQVENRSLSAELSP